METNTSTFLQFFLLILISVLVSFTFFVFASVFVLSSGFFRLMGPVMNPVSESFMYGAIFGILHGLITSFMIYWRRSDTTALSTVISSFYAMEIVLLIAFVVVYAHDYFKQPAHLRFFNANTSAHDIYVLVYNLIGWFIIISIIFLIPSVIIGIINKFALKILPENLLLYR